MPYPGASYREVNDNLKTAVRTHSGIRFVLRSVEDSYLIEDKDTLHKEMGEYPTYLYNRNPFDDLKYLLNKDVIASYCLPMTARRLLNGEGGVDSFDSYSAAPETADGQEKALRELSDYRKELRGTPGSVPQKELTAEEAEMVKENVSQNLVSIAKAHPESKDTASNLYGYLKGTVPGQPLLFSAHLDTVKPGIGKKAVLREDGTITSDGTTVLGADDVSGLTSILEALTVIQEKHLDHPDLEIFITVSEEPYCEGSRFAEYDRLKAKQGYVLDLDGPVGRAAIAAPSIISLKVEVEGKASHAGFAPEKGINALSIAADALSHIRTGRVYNDITVNFGTIHGGSGRNIVPERITIEGEIRGTEHENALCEAELIRQIFEKSAKKYGGSIQFTVTEHIHS